MSYLSDKLLEGLGFNASSAKDHDRSFKDNLYDLLYLNSTEKVWGLISGEMLRILEPESKRSREIGALMFKSLS